MVITNWWTCWWTCERGGHKLWTVLTISCQSAGIS